MGIFNTYRGVLRFPYRYYVNGHAPQHDHLELIPHRERTEFKRRVPLINASHHLQIGEDDRNCSLYAHNFCLAVCAMAADQEIAPRIFSSAEDIERLVISGADPADAISTLSGIFQNDLKRFLPQYYKADGSPCTAAELKTFHMRQRWDVSGVRIARFAIEED